MLLLRGFEAPTQTYQDFFTLFYRRLTGSYTASVSPSYICNDDSSVKILYAKETWHSFPKGFDHCFDMILGYDQRLKTLNISPLQVLPMTGFLRRFQRNTILRKMYGVMQVVILRGESMMSSYVG